MIVIIFVGGVGGREHI